MRSLKAKELLLWEYVVWVKKFYPLRFSEIFSKRLRLFKQNLKQKYTSIVCSYLQQIKNFYSIISKFDTGMPY